MSFRKPLTVTSGPYRDNAGYYVGIQYYNSSIHKNYINDKETIVINSNRTYKTFSFNDEVILFDLPLFAVYNSKIATDVEYNYFISCKLRVRFRSFLEIESELTKIGKEWNDGDIFVALINISNFLKSFGKTCRKMYKEDNTVSFKECFDKYFESTKFELLLDRLKENGKVLC